MSSDRDSLYIRDAAIHSHGGFEAFFSELSGDWNLTRQISDGSRFLGSARFTNTSEDCYRLEESGHLLLQEAVTLNAMREWQWIYFGNGLLDIRYAEKDGGGSYHRVELSAIEEPEGQAWRGKAIHYCGKDIYTGMYHLAENSLNIRHEISGPKKEMVIKSQYYR